MAAQTAGTRVPGAVSCLFVLLWALPAAAATPVVLNWGYKGPPPSNIAAGAWYIFRAPGTLSKGSFYVIENKPKWATFDPKSGLLMGRPVNANAGIYANVRISVTNGTVRHSYPSFPILVYRSPRSLSFGLTWNPPTEYEDGRALNDLVGYRIYRGPAPDRLQPVVFVSNPGLTRYVMEPPPPGRHYFAVTAVNYAGAESALSPVVSQLFE